MTKRTMKRLAGPSGPAQLARTTVGISEIGSPAVDAAQLARVTGGNLKITMSEEDGVD